MTNAIADLLEGDVSISHIGRVVELHELSNSHPSGACERTMSGGNKKKKDDATYCPLVKVKLPRSMEIPKSELQITEDSEHRLFGDGMYA